MTTTETLPAVAKSIFTDCKKCGAERYHTVLAHTSETAAKVQCEVCGAKKTYKLAKPKAAKTTKSKTTRTRTPKVTHQDEYAQLMETHAGAETATYNMKLKFAQNQKLQHPKFGLGLIRASYSDKIEVVFPDEVRALVHNRG